MLPMTIPNAVAMRFFLLRLIDNNFHDLVAIPHVYPTQVRQFPTVPCHGDMFNRLLPLWWVLCQI